MKGSYSSRRQTFLRFDLFSTAHCNLSPRVAQESRPRLLLDFKSGGKKVELVLFLWNRLPARTKQNFVQSKPRLRLSWRAALRRGQILTSHLKALGSNLNASLTANTQNIIISIISLSDFQAQHSEEHKCCLEN